MRRCINIRMGIVRIRRIMIRGTGIGGTRIRRSLNIMIIVKAKEIRLI
jgi:hypothetical protein